MKYNLNIAQIFFYLLIMSFSSVAETLVSIRYKTGLNPTKYQTDSKNVHLELGDEVKSIIINEPGNYKIYLQTETSVTIADGGPHLDFIDLKHGKSRLVELVKKNNEFQFIDLTNEMVFPQVSLEEFVTEARRLGGDRWAEIARQCKSPQGFPCEILPSKFIFTFKKEFQGKWVDQGSLILVPPMGC